MIQIQFWQIYIFIVLFLCRSGAEYLLFVGHKQDKAQELGILQDKAQELGI